MKVEIEAGLDNYLVQVLRNGGLELASTTKGLVIRRRQSSQHTCRLCDAKAVFISKNIGYCSEHMPKI